MVIATTPPLFPSSRQIRAPLRCSQAWPVMSRAVSDISTAPSPPVLIQNEVGRNQPLVYRVHGQRQAFQGVSAQ